MIRNSREVLGILQTSLYAQTLFVRCILNYVTKETVPHITMPADTFSQSQCVWGGAHPHGSKANVRLILG